MIVRHLATAAIIAALFVPGAEPRAQTPPMIDRGPIGALAGLGASPPTRAVDIAVTLRYREAAALEALVDDRADPRSPRYRQFLTPAEFAARFAPTQTDHDRVVSALRTAGFAVTGTYPNRSVILARAPAPVAARAFATEIHEFDQPGVGVRYANIRPGTVPAGIADVVSGVVGLSDIRAFATHIRAGTPRVLGPADAAALTSKVIGPDGGYGPVVYANAYALLGAQGFTGAGRSGAVVIDAEFLDSDIAAYLAYFGVTRTGRTMRVRVGQGPPAGLTLDSTEATLDVETISSLAPGADITVYQGHDFANPANLLATYNQLVSDDQVDEVNASLGYCELAFGSFATMVEQVALQGTALGITFHASTGDNGSYVYGCSPKTVTVAVPAAAPHVVAVGGTDLRIDTSTGQETAEHAWITRFNGATGGGVSTRFARPGFQANVPGVLASGRNLPDVAFSADPNDGTSFYFQGGFIGPEGGTSLASPIFGAALLQLDQMTGGRAGFVTPSIYAAWLRFGYVSGGKRYFRDITKGVDGNVIAPGDKAEVGYDRTTGIGALLFAHTGPRLHP